MKKRIWLPWQYEQGWYPTFRFWQWSKHIRSYLQKAALFCFLWYLFLVLFHGKWDEELRRLIRFGSLNSRNNRDFSVDLHHLQDCQRLPARSFPVVVVVIQWAIKNAHTIWGVTGVTLPISTSEWNFTIAFFLSSRSVCYKSFVVFWLLEGSYFGFSSVWSVWIFFCTVLWLLKGCYFGSVWCVVRFSVVF